MPPRTTTKEATIAHPTKIATCCYCGTRAALVLTGRERHELACSSCGAPLHDLKMLPRKRSGDRETVRPSAIRQKSKPKPAKKKYKKRKSRWADIFDDAFDIIEDIFD
ncbi:hypothetical protein [uncultured Tateyamaria sp.]|uniref:hypothetical protein n=1 Tax=uncultured Tateyamaria sp. TaxID=455651 RepID=UPI002627A6B4|nr:hypothetical protein [uncultured Tateyamaria sp.]